MASGRIAGSGGGTEDQSYFSIGGFAKAGIFSKILPGKLVNKQCATNTSKHDRALGSKSTGKLETKRCVGSHHPGPLHCEGLLPQIFYIWQPILPLKKIVELRMGHTMAARTDTQVDISESRPEILVVLSSQLLFTNLLFCVCRLKVLCMNPMRLTISWSVRTNVRFKSCPPGERTCPEKPQAPSSRC